jgi:ankyrin repeat protein
MRITKLLFLTALLAGVLPSAFAGPLHHAAVKGDVAEVRRLVESGENIESTADIDETALYDAACFGRTEVVKLLLEKGANVETKAKGGWTPLMIAAEHGHEETIHLLIDHGAKLEARTSDGKTALWIAAFHGESEVVNTLLDRGADIEAKTKTGISALMIAAGKGQSETVSLLLQRGADINAKDNEGSTVSVWAALGKIDLRHTQDAALQNAKSRIDYLSKMTMYDDKALTEALITAETTQLLDWLATATIPQKVALLTDIKKQVSRASVRMDELNAEASAAIAGKQDPVPFRKRAGQIKAYINVLNEIKAILEQS